MANDNAQLAVRFRADNPGMWLWHCPVEAGLPATMVEAPEQLSTPTIPDDHLEACRAYGMKTEADPLDLDGSATSVPGENHGWVLFFFSNTFPLCSPFLLISCRKING